MSIAVEPPTGAARRPLTSTNVLADPNPRNEIAETEPAPPCPPPAAVLATLVLPLLVVADTIFSSCSAFEAPVRWISSLLRT